MKSASVNFPCPNHPEGYFELTLTGQHSKDGEVQTKTCQRCGRSHPIIDYLGKACEARGDGYLYILDGPLCWFCDPPVPIPLHTKPGPEGPRLAMRVVLRDANGEPIPFWDETREAYMPSEAVGLRLVEAGGNKVQFQPYGRRGRDRYGVE